MVNIEVAISFLQTKVGNTTYSMYGSRNFSDGTCDCSGAVYTALRQGGASNLGYIASTETMHGWLLNNGFGLIAENSDWSMQRGDVVIWGQKGYSAGAGGHTGICTDGQNWLECTAWKGLGETIQSHDARWLMNDQPYFYVYRQGEGATNPTTPATPNPVPSGPTPSVNVTYALRNLNGAWNSDVTNFSGGDDGFAGMPNGQHDLLTISVNHGSVKYRAHVLGGGWQDWVTGSNKNDAVNGCAGLAGVPIDGVQVVYITPNGEGYQQAYYRSQTTQRGDWLDVACDDGNTYKNFDDFAGMIGEPLDRLQIGIYSSNPF
ncbi:peptidoglycan amidohydrolase family protein [Latilactobacillus curvatus]|uniref:Bacteriophage lysin domain-containing protein n=1 Tax=Latilactobacillus curvatus TaxID=28038 RepID=A0ABN6GH69_LATCU|nr:hypothetical protein LTWDN19_00200 [Latilactobacillus curvatus]